MMSKDKPMVSKLTPNGSKPPKQAVALANKIKKKAVQLAKKKKGC